jgi:hypothetical protein
MTQRCFISARYGVQLDTLQTVLDDANIEWAWAQNNRHGATAVETISQAIKRADFVVGVVTDDELNGNVMIEVGIAIGLEIPVLLLTTAKKPLPFDLASFRHFNTNLGNRKLLSLQLDLFIRSLAPSKSDQRRPVTPSSGQLGRVRDRPAPKLFGSALEQNIAAAIHQAGGRVSIPSQSDQKVTPDLLMWLPEIDTELFNPAAIEAKKTIGAQDLPDLQQRLGEFVSNSNLGCGLIIVNSVFLARNLAKIMPHPFVFITSLGDFRSKLQQGELAAWIRQERNRLAHGSR